MDAGEGDLIFVGAEAEVRRSLFLGAPSVRKRRLPKPYRRAELDERIRRERTRLEALVTAEAARAGVPVPRVLDVDLGSATLELEEVAGEQLRVLLDKGDAFGVGLCREFGRVVGRLHGAGLTHGDLTTSNVIVRDGRPVLIDFGLAQRTRELEERGVDLHLVERTFDASHPGRPELLEAFWAGYLESLPEAPAVRARTEEIKARGRYV